MGRCIIFYNGRHIIYTVDLTSARSVVRMVDLQSYSYVSTSLRSSMFAFRVSGLLTKTRLFKMAFVRVLVITGLELRAKNKND